VVVGEKTTGGSASGSLALAAIAGGGQTAGGFTTATVTLASSTQGSRSSAGASAGTTVAYTGSAVGDIVPTEGSATESLTFTAAATGTTPALPVMSGSAGGSYVVTGVTASGVRVPKGLGSTEVEHSGSATGTYAPRGTVTSTTALGVTATGAWPPPDGAVSARTLAFAGSATGQRFVVFVTPTATENIKGDPLFGRYHLPVGVTVIKRDGVYVDSPYPWIGELQGLTEGVDYFLGGRTYRVTDEVAAALAADGYTAS
jgi:hypothetical protein